MRRIKGDGVELAVTDEGEGPPVLLIHGYPDSSRVWRNQVSVLTQAGLRAIAPDLRGFGESGKPDEVSEYRVGRSVADLVAVLDALEVEQTSVVGHDWGAGVAWAMALMAPDRVARLAVMSTGHPTAYARHTISEREKSWYMLLFQFPEAEELLRRDDWTLLRAWAASHPDLEGVIADAERPGALTAGLNWYRANVHPRNELEPAHQLLRITVDTLGIWSSGDAYLEERAMKESGEFVTGTWRYERIDAGHWMQLDASERVNELLLEFLVLSAVELRAAFAARELSPVEVLDSVTEHEELGAFVTYALDEARRAAKEAEKEYARGEPRPLSGLTLAVKDLYDTAGIRTTYGSKIFAGHVPAADAAAVRMARAAGAVIVGKTLTHEFAWGITSVNPHFPPCRNPYDPERVPGGSSGGSAVALATGQAALALGTDTGGSIRIPASFCGVSGLKPTFGRISTEGVYPLARSLDHAGPMARTPADVKLLYEALACRQGIPRRGGGLGAGRAPAERARTIATCPDLILRPLEPGIRRAYEHAVQSLDAELLELSFAHAERLQPTYVTIQNAEAAHAHACLFPARRHEYSADVAARLDLAQSVTLADYVEATAERERIRSAFSRIFAAADLLITPVAAVPPELREEPDPQGFRDGVLPFTVPQDLAGLPSAAVPVGFDDLGMPVAVQLTGPPWSEGRVLQAADALFSATASARAESASAP